MSGRVEPWMGCLPSKQETWLKSEKNSYKLSCVCVWTHVYLWPVSQISKYNYFASNHYCTIFISDKLVTRTNLHTGVSVKKKRKKFKARNFKLSSCRSWAVEPRTDEFPGGVCKKKYLGNLWRLWSQFVFFTCLWSTTALCKHDSEKEQKGLAGS